MRKHWMITGVAALALTILAAALVVSGVPGGPVAAQSPAPGTITVRGLGEASGAPDVAYVSLGVDTRNASLSEAMSEANSVMDAVIEAVRGLEIAAEDIQTVDFSVWSDEPMTPEGAPAEGTRFYRVTNVVRITVRDTGLMQNVIDAAVAAGANRIYGVTFGLEDPAALERDARLAALENARERAAQIAEAIGVTLGEPTIVVEGDSFGQGVVMDMAARGLGGGGGIQQGQLSVQVQVQVTFETVR